MLSYGAVRAVQIHVERSKVGRDLQTMSERDPERVFPTYMRNVAGKAERVQKFMTKNAGYKDNSGTWRRKTLALYFKALQEQITRMENDWDLLRVEAVLS